MRKLLTVTAMSGMLASPMFTAAAWADDIPMPMAAGLNSSNEAAAKGVCDTLALSLDADGSSPQSNIYSAEVIPGAVSQISGPTEVAGTRVKDLSSVQHAGVYVPSTTQIRGRPFRTGGSVNLFGDQWSTAGYWTDSTYRYDASFTSRFSYAYSCQVMVEKYVPEQRIEVRAQGHYVIVDDYKGNDEAATRQNCEQQRDNGQPWWGDLYIPNENNARCQFEGTPASVEIIPESWEAAVPVGMPVAQTAIEQDQTDELNAFEDHGGPVQVTGEYKIGQVVVCISPSTGGTKGNPGAWKPQNGYSGVDCNTPYFTTAPWGSGSQTSNGTYISVPNYAY